MTKISKNILLISGSGRNAGKTSFILKVLETNSQTQVAAIKITPHFHEPTTGLISIAVTENYRIFQETNGTSSKDSSRFLLAGAERVFYIQTTDRFLDEAFCRTTEHLLPGQPVIVESAHLRKFIVPGLYLFIQKTNETAKPLAQEMQQLADETVFSEDCEFSLNPKSVLFKSYWKINTHDIH